MNLNWIIYDKSSLAKVAELRTNHSISISDAFDLIGAEHLEMQNIDDPDLNINGKEYWSDDLAIVLEEDYLDIIKDMSTEGLAEIVRNADTWDAPECYDAMQELCDRAGRKLLDMVRDGADCSEHFKALRYCASEEWFADTPDVSDNEEDLIDWLRHGAEQADAVHLAYAIQDILNIDLGL